MVHDYDVMRYLVLNYLKDIKHKKLIVEQAFEQIERQESALTLQGIDYKKKTQVTTSTGNTNPQEQNIMQLLELRQQAIDEQAHNSMDIEQARNICASCTNTYILWLKYVEGYQFEEIGRIVGYSLRSVKRRAHDGVIQLYYEMPEEYRRAIPNAAPT